MGMIALPIGIFLFSAHQDYSNWQCFGYSYYFLARSLRHDPACREFNPHLRQLLHVAFKIAAKQGERYTKMLAECEEAVSRNVTGNLFERHLKPLFL